MLFIWYLNFICTLYDWSAKNKTNVNIFTVWNCLKFKRVTSAYWIPRLFTLQNSSLNLSEYIGFYDSKTHHLSIFEVETGTRSVNFHAIFNRNNNYHSNSETMKLHFFQIKCLQRCGSYFFFFFDKLNVSLVKIWCDCRPETSPHKTIFNALKSPLTFCSKMSIARLILDLPFYAGWKLKCYRGAFAITIRENYLSQSSSITIVVIKS